jgi:hypothetical protein
MDIVVVGQKSGIHFLFAYPQMYDNSFSTLYPQSCWYIIQVMHKLKTTDPISNQRRSPTSQIRNCLKIIKEGKKKIDRGPEMGA